MSINDKKDRSTIIQSGIIVLIIVMIGYTGYTLNEISTKFEDFVNKWENRIKVSNTINNGTRDVIKDEISNLKNNLSQHRIVTNNTFNEVKSIENQTAKLVEAFNKSNEEGRDEAVEKLSGEHEIIMNALNISKTDNQSEAASKIDQLLEILNKTQ